MRFWKLLLVIHGCLTLSSGNLRTVTLLSLSLLCNLIIYLLVKELKRC